MKVISVVGARPEFIQAMPVSRELRTEHEEILVHTGQHYDYPMSQVFFEELEIPAPDYNLEVGSGSHAYQTAQILIRFEDVLVREQPELVIVRGDTNSTLAGALAASKLHIPVAHIEAGERSFNRLMPEEINRLVADRLSDLHFCTSQTAVQHLLDEGIGMRVHWVGDVMLDALMMAKPIAERKSDILSRLELDSGKYALVTIHRPGNTDDPICLAQIVKALNLTSETIIFPVHPRTRNVLSSLNIHIEDHVRLIDPVSYFDMIVLEQNARLIATDSGGVQREAYFLGIPCLTLRDETEWMEIISAGWNRLVGADSTRIIEVWNSFTPASERPMIFGEGSAAQRILEIIDEWEAELSAQRKDRRIEQELHR